MNLSNNESSNWELESLVNNFPYEKIEIEFVDFAIWVEGILNSRIFLDEVDEFVEINQKLKTEPVGQSRTQLVERLSKITYG